jgi:hypothetical protein
MIFLKMVVSVVDGDGCVTVGVYNPIGVGVVVVV